MATLSTTGLPPETHNPGSERTPGPLRGLEGGSWRQRRGRWDVKLSPYLYISPFYIVFAVVGLFPLVYTAYVSVHDWHLIGGQGAFVGAQNYLDVIAQPRFATALRNTFSIFLLSSVPQVLAAIVIAAILDANIRARTFWRMGVLLPYVVAPVAVALIFSRLFADQAGLINTLLGQVGVGPVRWHADPLSSHIAIATMVNFRWTGYNTLIFLAAMQAVPRDLYEAAVIDGASRLRQFVSVTVPMLRPTVIFVVITSTIGGLQIFDEPRMFDQLGMGGADRQWMTVTMFLYELGWGAQKSFGRAAAVAWILFLIIIVIGLINFAITRRIASGGAPPPTKTKTKTTKTTLRGGAR
ncbi:carbohydrate ABC transporter permease [Actinotalea sp. K2]|uniref:carbohydrate ABC transporter permease n=1 Tax=Actinotalea sp. K2 TaxID=2939438 RepID=UPI002017111E|nr:sugar ABC transporter permease [Actinotalea sp. K2]MCL3862546.1 sugar ABC transporter permease [Actinotalea sp. K2]